MKKESASKRIKELKKEIQFHDRLYYQLDKPQITDFEYDELLKELVDLETQHPELKTPDSPSGKVPGQALPHFEKKSRRQAMLSLQNSYSIEELKSFYDRILKFFKAKSLTLFMEPKLDGMAVELIYEKGFFKTALSRGDGITGEDISATVKTIRKLPLCLENFKPSSQELSHQKSENLPIVELRGEILIFKEDFKRINEEQELNTQPVFSNPRNLAAGSVRQLDPKVTAQRPLRCFIHSPGGIEIPHLKTQEDFIKQVQHWGLPAFKISSSRKLKAPYSLCLISRSFEDVVSYYNQMKEMRSKLPFEIDGIVLKLNSFSQQKKTGAIARSPRWAVAGKFPPEQKTAFLEKIKLQVGRTGVITPVAVLKPVQLGGAKIRHASLHNFKELERKNIREGSYVLVHRAGDVIPEIIKALAPPPSALKNKKNQSSATERAKTKPRKVSPPKSCPKCKTKVKSQGDYLVCPNSQCPAVKLNKWIHFVSKKAMDIDFLGAKSLEKFSNWGWLKSYSDIYDLKRKNIKDKEGFGEKSYHLLVKSLEKSKNPSLKRFLFALGIPLIGEETAGKISEKLYEKKKSLSLLSVLSLLKNISTEELEAIPDIGPLGAKSLKEAFEDAELTADIEGLAKRGVILKAQGLKSNRLQGLSFVITGTLPRSRPDLKADIELEGGRVLSQVSSQTNFLISGDKAGSKKQKALDLKVPILSWNKLLDKFKFLDK